MTDDEIAALAPVLLPYRVQLEAAWAGRKPNTRRARATRTGVQPTLLDLDTAAARLSCSRATVYELIAKGELVRRVVGKRGTRVTASSLQEYISRDQYRGIKRV
ncbi:MAG: hypothetical protein JWO98_4328 [Frankiales bacterium]|nr:hypothetical protein [Frankiales bacterium]